MVREVLRLPTLHEACFGRSRLISRISAAVALHILKRR